MAGLASASTSPAVRVSLIDGPEARSRAGAEIARSKLLYLNEGMPAGPANCIVVSSFNCPFSHSPFLVLRLV